MYHINSLTCLVLTTLWALHVPLAQAAGSSFSVATHTPKATGSPSSNSKAAPGNVMKLQKSTGSSSKTRYSKALAQGNGAPEVEGTYGTSTLKADETGMAVRTHVYEQLLTSLKGLAYTTSIQFGDQDFTVIVDTGSSDTWLAESNFTCLKGAQSDCMLGATYTRSSTFIPIDNENFEIAYSDERSLNGVFGKEKVTLAGITVNDAQVALVEVARWAGDGVSSGVLGLGFPANTRAFSGTNYAADPVDNQIPYNPLFTSMYVEGSVPQIFSIALDRDGTGHLAIGGTPDIPFDPTFASSPFQLLTTYGVALAKTFYTFYVITTNGFQYQSAQSNWNTGSWLTYFGNPNDPTKVQVVIDSGTPVNYLPPTIASAVNALFDPPAVYRKSLGYYTVPCNAKAPRFGVKIGMETFYINPLDMIIPLNTGECISGVTLTGNGGVPLLGEPFLKNVLAVFDVGASEMRFAAR